MTLSTGYTIRPATPSDAAILAEFRAAMFTDMGAALENGAVPFWTTYFVVALTDGRYRALLAERAGEVAACAGLMVFPTVPTPGDPSGQRAHIQGVYTLPTHRGRGLAVELTRALLRVAQAQDIGSVNLNASVMGQGVYQRLGFVAAKAPELRLNLREACL